MTQQSAELVCDTRAELGEGPVWDDLQQRLYWLDIHHHELHQYDHASQTGQCQTFDDDVGAAILGEPDTIFLGVGNRLIRHRWSTQESTTLATTGRPGRFNDGGCDPIGRLYLGTMTSDHILGASALYRWSATEQALHPAVTGVTLSNGFAWSGDGSAMYYIDTATERIDVFDYDQDTAALSGRRTLVDLSETPGRPDGMTIDAQDRLWVAMARGSTVRCFDTTGTQQHLIPLPVISVTSCTFGGPGLDDLWVTTARMAAPAAELTQRPYSGGLFRVPGLTRGRATVRLAEED